MKKFLVLLTLSAVLFSCDVMQNVAGALQLTQCEYKYKSISGLTLAGVNVQDVSSLTSLNPLTLTNLLSVFSNNTSAIPLQFTLNVDVKNPGTKTALLSGLQYVLEIDNVQMTTGSLDKKLEVSSGGTSVLPVNLSFDLRKAMSGQSADAIKNMALNFVGIGDKATNVTLKVKPSLSIGGQAVASPSYIPISFSYGKGYK